MKSEAALCRDVLREFEQAFGLAPFPLVAAYTASKTAIEGFSASLELEMRSVVIGVKLVEPGYGPSTRFTENGQQRMQGLVPEAYAPFARSAFAALAVNKQTTAAADVAEAVWRAVHDVSGRLHFPAGADALALASRRSTSNETAV